MIFIVFLIMAAIGGINAPLVKANLAFFPPFTLVAARSILSAIIIVPIIKKTDIINLRLLKEVLPASLLFAANWIFFASGVGKTSVIMANVIYAPTALLVAALGLIFLKEKLNKEQIFGLILVLIGMSILIYQSIISQDLLSFGKPLGNFLEILGLISWSSYLIVSRKISQKYSAITITFFNFLTTFVITVLVSLVETEISPFSHVQLTTQSIALLLTLSLVSSVTFFALYQWIIKNTSAFISSLVLYPMMLISIYLGIVFFDEKLTPSLVGGSLLVIIGIFLSTSYKYAKEHF